MNLEYRKSSIKDIDILTKTRVEVLRAANKLLHLLVKEAKARGITAISLVATEMRRPLYETYGFIQMNHEMELPEESL